VKEDMVRALGSRVVGKVGEVVVDLGDLGDEVVVLRVLLRREPIVNTLNISLE
jgi:hypothetical protein